MSEEQREMTLDEWMAQLPKHHAANQELARLREQCERSKAIRCGKCGNDVVRGDGMPLYDQLSRLREENEVLTQQRDNHIQAYEAFKARAFRAEARITKLEAVAEAARAVMSVAADERYPANQLHRLSQALSALEQGNG